MVMQKHSDMVGYFKDKVGKSYHEIERKKLNVDIADIERRLESVNGVEVFKGVITSHYYHVDTSGDEGLSFLRGFFGLGDIDIHVGSGGGFSRLRKMVAENGTEIYFAETRIYDVNIEGFTTSHMDKGVMFDSTQYGYVMGIHATNSSINFRQKEVKNRLCCVVPSIPGLEYCLDEISEPVKLNPYLEIEISSKDEIDYELLIDSISKLGLDPGDFVRISARQLIENELKK